MGVNDNPTACSHGVATAPGYVCGACDAENRIAGKDFIELMDEIMKEMVKQQPKVEGNDGE